MAPECSGPPAGARGRQVHSGLKATTHTVSQRVRQKCSVTPAGWFYNHAGMDEQDIVELFELQRLTRELLAQLTAMFPLEEAAGL